MLTVDINCIFCKIAVNEEPANFLKRWSNAFAITPLNPVVEGHTLIIPYAHVDSYTRDPNITAATMMRAADFAKENYLYSNLITSDGELATQSVFHLHVHIIPRQIDDGLKLPWSGNGA